MRMAWNAAFAAGAILCTFAPAAALEPRQHDRRVEQAALARAAAKIGEMRGALAHDARLADIIARPRRTLLPPLPSAPPAALPPMVMNGKLASGLEFIDPVITGSNRKNGHRPVQ